MQISNPSDHPDGQMYTDLLISAYRKKKKKSLRRFLCTITCDMSSSAAIRCCVSVRYLLSNAEMMFFVMSVETTTGHPISFTNSIVEQPLWNMRCHSNTQTYTSCYHRQLFHFCVTLGRCFTKQKKDNAQHIFALVSHHSRTPTISSPVWWLFLTTGKNDFL